MLVKLTLSDIARICGGELFGEDNTFSLTLHVFVVVSYLVRIIRLVKLKQILVPF